MISLTSVLQYSMKTILICLLLILDLFSQRDLENYPKIYSQLGTPLFTQVNNFKALSQRPLFHLQDLTIQDYVKKVKIAIDHGELIDSENSTHAKETKVYLQELREIQKLHDKIEKSYKKQLYKSINENNQSAFYAITSVSLPFLITDARLKEKVVHYYKKTKRDRESSLHKQDSLTYLESLSRDLKLDQKSYAYMPAIFKTSKKEQNLEERDSLSKFVPNPGNNKPVQVVSIRTKNGFDLYLENHAYYDVSIELKVVKLVNLLSSKTLPFVGSFPAHSRTKILALSVKDPHNKSLFQTLYSTTIGRLNPQYDKGHLYALPYAKGKSYQLTQGFNGEETHKGHSAYALDFKMDEGTKIHAMREGTVVALEDKQTEHGFSPEFTDKSNYIIIQHDDGTMAMYGHLKNNGVKVNLGQKIYKHAFIGLSGNTGYSSGPHLHVHISAIKNLQSGSSSIPFSFLAKRGKIDFPVLSSSYIAE